MVDFTFHELLDGKDFKLHRDVLPIGEDGNELSKGAPVYMAYIRKEYEKHEMLCDMFDSMGWERMEDEEIEGEGYTYYSKFDEEVE